MENIEIVLSENFDLIIVEGLWHTGKTFLSLNLERSGYFFIKEPDHNLETKRPENVLEWYVDKHTKNLEKAILLLSQNKKIVIERSLISTIAYNLAINKESVKNNKDNFINIFEQQVNKVRSLGKNIGLIILTSSLKNIKEYTDTKLDMDLSEQDLQEIENNIIELSNYYKKVAHLDSIKLKRV